MESSGAGWETVTQGARAPGTRWSPSKQRAAVQLTIPVGVFQIPIRPTFAAASGRFLNPLPVPGCGQTKRHLYLRSLVIGRLVDYQGPLCQGCAGLILG